MMIFNLFSRIKKLNSIRQIERSTERYMAMPISRVTEDYEFFTSAASDAEKKSKMIAGIYQAQASIESSKIAANSAGIQALSEIQQQRLKYRSLKEKLLEAAKGEQ